MAGSDSSHQILFKVKPHSPWFSHLTGNFAAEAFAAMVDVASLAVERGAVDADAAVDLVGVLGAAGDGDAGNGEADDTGRL